MTIEYIYMYYVLLEKAESMIKARERRKGRKGKVCESVEESSEPEVEKRRSDLEDASEATEVESEEIYDCIKVRSETSQDFSFLSH